MLFVSLAWYFERRCGLLSCVSYVDAPAAQCAAGQTGLRRLPLSDSTELAVEDLQVAREQSTLTALVRLKGRFWNATDQNVYLFVGQPLPEGVTSSYSLSRDTQYAADLPYAVRDAVRLPHGVDIRVGVMAPQASAHTPQVYINDPVRADAVGAASGVAVEADGQVVRLKLPLDEFYRRKGIDVPRRVGVTVATARDYVGFIDQASVAGVAVGETKAGGRGPLPPAVYPAFDYGSHAVKRLTFERAGGAARVELETESPIEDWAQTNLHFFFVPYPPGPSPVAPSDPSGTLVLPHPWSFYCGVYSPNRLTCKASYGSDFTYDSGYSERARLEAPAGTHFGALGGAKYALELTPEAVAKMTGGRGGALALLLTVGRDGFGPTSCYGWDCSSTCRLLRRLEGSLR
jgi:hypothetical protein